jgi:hypothetical protein
MTDTTELVTEVVSPTTSWECCVCYEDGKSTGQLTLSCNHNVCLECYTKLLTANLDSPPCPMCRRTIRTTDGPTYQQMAEMRSMQTSISILRAGIAAETTNLEARLARMTTYANENRMVRYLTEDIPLSAALRQVIPVRVTEPVTPHQTYQSHQDAEESIVNSSSWGAAAREAGRLASVGYGPNSPNEAQAAAKAVAVAAGAPQELVNRAGWLAWHAASRLRHELTTYCCGCHHRYLNAQVILRSVLRNGSISGRRLTRCRGCAPDLELDAATRVWSVAVPAVVPVAQD